MTPYGATAREPGTSPGSRAAGDDLVGRSASEIAELVRRGDVSASEVVSAHLERVDERNGAVNALVHVARASALAEAAAIDEARRHGELPGPLAGVPFTVKDIIAVRGMPAEAGSVALRGYVPDHDATSVARLRAAGAICLGKTNTPEFALWPITWNETHGYTRNPAPGAADRSPGGSSGGEAAAVAAGMSSLGLGSDYGGSVRWPAQCTGLASLRPTAGRVPGDGQLPARRIAGRWVMDPASVQGRLQVVGPMARTVADVALAARLLFGNVPGEDSTGRPWSEGPVDLSNLDVAWCDGDGTIPVEAELRSAAAHAAGLLAAEVRSVEHRLPAALSEAGALFSRLRATDQQEEILSLGAPDTFGAPIRELLAATRPVDAEEVRALWRQRDSLRRQMLVQMPDLLLMPVASIAAPRLDDREFVVDGRRLNLWEPLTACRAISLFGLPVAVVPVGTTADGRAIAVQIVGRPDRDEVALAAAAALERSCAGQVSAA